MDILYLVGGHGEEEALAAHPFPNLKVVVVPVLSWDQDLSPWKAENVFKGAAPFAGGADSFLKHLLSVVLPQEEKSLCIQRRFLVGYSLAGLFTLYAATKTDLFFGFASVSGSLWFDHFVEYLSSSSISGEKFYLSLGDKEKKSRNERMKRVEECTLEVESLLKEKGKDVVYRTEEGNHFQDPSGRILRSITWLLS